MTKFVRVREVTEVLGISRTGAYMLVREGTLPSVRIAGGIRVPASALKEFAQAMEEKALAERDRTISN